MSYPWQGGAPLPSPVTGHALQSICVQLPTALEYQAAFWGQLQELGEPGFWARATPDDTSPEIAAEMWREIILPAMQSFGSGEGCDQTDNVKTYSNQASFITYYPNDPRYSPDFVPEGYNNPPWYFATVASNIAYGTVTGDIVTSIDRFPPGSLPTILPASGLPRIRFNVYGQGTIRMVFRNMVQGSRIQITRDDDLFSLQFIDVSKDLVGIPAETGLEVIVEQQFDTPGPHHVDAIVVSWADDSFPFINHGGGLVRVELEGLTTAPEENYMDVGLSCADGLLTLNVNGAPVDTVDLAACIQAFTAADLRGNGDQLEAYDADTAAWSPVTGATWLNTVAGGDMLRPLKINTNDVPQLHVQRLNDNNRYIVVTTDGSNHQILGYGQTSRLKLRQVASGTTFNMDYTGKVNLMDSGERGPYDGFVNIETNQARDALRVISRNASAKPQTWEQYGLGVVAEMSREGWFSATEKLIINGRSSTGTWRQQGRILSEWDDSTDATRKATLTIGAYDYVGIKAAIKVAADGVAAKLAFFGNEPVQRTTIELDPSGLTDGEIAVLTALHDVGLIVWDQTP